MGKYYLTTAIVYVNDAPGLHFVYEQIGADALARFHRQRGDEVFFLTGTDENGTKIDRAAKAKGEQTRPFVDALAARYQEVARLYDVSFDRFIRTTDADHVEGVQWFVKRWIENGDVYEATYEGLYCVSCEAFYEESDLVDGKCPIHTPRATIERLSEKNYFFRLSKYQKALEDLYRTNPDFCVPDFRRNEVLGWIQRGLKDVSVSRRGLDWGIPWPGDPQQTVYVWFDALINYATGVGFGSNAALFKKFWPADVHVIGKDITRFHCIYWPAMLLAAGVELPKKVHVHGFLQYRGQRLSKTSGNMIDPFAAAQEWGADAIRYLLLRQAGFTTDADVSPEIFTNRYNADLANNLGNLAQRTVTMIARYREGRIPEPRKGGSAELQEVAQRVSRAHDAAASRLAFDEALASIFELVDATNRHYDRTKPWTLARTGPPEDLDDALYSAAEALRLIAHLLWPYLPQATTKIATALNTKLPGPGSAEQWAKDSSWGRLLPGNPLRSSAVLFPRIEPLEKVAT